MAETLSNIFHITEVHYIEEREQSLVSVRGWFDWEKKGGDALFALLDKDKVQAEESFEEGMEIRLKYLRIRAAMDREYHLSVKLPGNFRRYKTFSLWQEERERCVCLLKIDVKKLTGLGKLYDSKIQKAKELWYGRGIQGFTEKLMARLGREKPADYMEFRKKRTRFVCEKEDVAFLILTYKDSDSGRDRLENSLKQQNYGDFTMFPFSEKERWEGNLTEESVVLVLPEDMELEPDCLGRVAQAREKNPNADFIYGDHDVLKGDGTYQEPEFKPDASEDLLRSRNYIGSFLAVSKRTFERAAGGLERDFPETGVYDYVLRCWESAECKYHIPQVLCHVPPKEYSDRDVGKEIEALREYYLRNGIEAKLEETGMPGIYRTVYPVKESPLISVIIPNKDHREDLKKCLDSILEKSSYPDYEIIIAENNSTEKETFSFYREMEEREKRIRVVCWEKEFNYSAINNFAAAQAKGEYYLFLNNDTEVIESRWMEEMVMHCARNEVGAVGAQLLYSDKTIQHAGVIIGMGGLAGHAFGGCAPSVPAYQEWKYAVRDLSAVTAACMMVKKEVFQQLGGFCEELAVAFNDVDLCLRIRSLGKLIVYNPFVKLYHHESKSRGMEDTEEKVRRFHKEVLLLAERHPWILKQTDSYYNPNLTIDRPDFSWNDRAIPCFEEEM